MFAPVVVVAGELFVVAVTVDSASAWRFPDKLAAMLLRSLLVEVVDKKNPKLQDDYKTKQKIRNQILLVFLIFKSIFSVFIVIFVAQGIDDY